MTRMLTLPCLLLCIGGGGNEKTSSNQDNKEQAEIVPETTTVVDPALEERKQLALLKEAEFEKQKLIVLDKTLDEAKRMCALYRIGELGTKQSADFLAHVYDHPIGRRHEHLAIIDMLGQYGPPEGVPLLQVASRHPGFGGDERWHAAKALARVQGDKAIPRLREMLADDLNATVRGQVRIELARLGDEPTIAGLRADVTRGSVAALYTVRAAGVTEAAPNALALCRPESKASLATRVRAAITALSLGERQAIPLLAKFLDNPEAVKASNISMEKRLAGATRQDFGDDGKKWLTWWNEEGNRQPVVTWNLTRGIRAEIIHGVISWARSKGSGPIISQEVCYLERLDHEIKFETETLRTYSRPELKLLGKLHRESYAITDIRRAGNKAFATFSYVGKPHFLPWWNLELEKTNNGWIVVRAVPRRS